MPLRALMVVGLLAVPLGVAAQSEAPTVPAGTRVYVTLDDGGTVLAGSLVSLSDTSVALLMRDGPRGVPLGDVALIEQHGDTSFDGTIRGASIVGGVCVIMCAQGARNGAHLAQIVAINGALGAAIGWWFDHRHVGRTSIYRRRRLRCHRLRDTCGCPSPSWPERPCRSAPRHP